MGLSAMDGGKGGKGGGATWLDYVQTGLDVAGFVPGIGEACDLINGGISLARGDYYGAAASLISAVPVVGDVIGKGAKLVRAADKAYTVYRAVDKATGEVEYVGMTCDYLRRKGEHAPRFNIQLIDDSLNNLSKGAARGVEQALIEIHQLGKNGGTLKNIINSISKKANPKRYQQLTDQGYDLLRSIGYPGA